MYMKSIRSLLQFTTILPLGIQEDLAEFGRRSYLYPLAGYVIGGLWPFRFFLSLTGQLQLPWELP